MDVSAVKYNKQLNSFAAPKISVQNTGDVFLSLLDNFRTAGTAEESSERVLSRITERADTTAVFKDTAQKTASKPNASKENPKTERFDTASASEKPKADKEDGQKIPAEENTARPANEETQTQTSEKTADDMPAQSLEQAEQDEKTENSPKDESGLNDEAADKAVVAALGNAAAAQVVSENVKTNETADMWQTDGETVSPDQKQVQTVPAAKTADDAQETSTPLSAENGKKAVPVENGKENVSAPDAETETQNVASGKVFEALTKSAPAKTQTKKQSADILPDQEAQSTPETLKTNEGRAARNLETDEQTAELAKHLPAGHKVKIETADLRSETAAATNTAEKTVVAAVHTKTADEALPSTDRNDILSETNAQENIKIKSSENDARGYEQSRSDAQAQQRQQQQTASFTPNAAGTAAVGGQSAQSAEFRSALKSGTDSVSGVTGASGSQTAGEAGQLPFNVQNGTLKGKAVAGTATAPKTVPTNELVDQIKVSISKAAKEGLEKININLKPKELGNIQVRLEVDGDGNMKASIIASRPETLDLLQRDASVLKQALADAGLKTGDNAFSFSYRGEQQQDASAFAQNENGRRGGSETNFNDTEMPNGETDELTEAIIASGWTSRHALNIRV